MKNPWHIFNIIALALGLLFAFGCSKSGGGDATSATDTTTETGSSSDTTEPGTNPTTHGTETGTEDDTGTGTIETDTGTGTIETDTGTGTIETDTGPSGKSCDDAYPMTLNHAPPLATQYALQKWDGWNYHLLKGAKAGAFLAFYTMTNPGDTQTRMDTVISLYTADGTTLLATADDAVPRLSQDSEIIFHVPADMDLCVKVEDWAGWAASSAPSRTNFKYYVAVLQIDDDGPGSNPDAEPNDSVATAQTVKYMALDAPSKTQVGGLYGMLDKNSDVDYFKYTTGPGILATTLYLLPSGPGSNGPTGTYGNGSTMEPSVVNVSNAAGEIVAEIDSHNGSYTLTMPTTAAFDGIVKIGPRSAAGTNDFYVVKFYNYDNFKTPEAETAGGNTNNTTATAEEPAFTPEASDATTLVTDVQGLIDPIEDVDYFKIPGLKAGNLLFLHCGAARNGSGLNGATFTVVDSTGTELQSETESKTAEVVWNTISGYDPSRFSKPAVAVPADGDYYLKINAGSQDSRVIGNYYMCFIGTKPTA
ncbi:MAG: hypothetical protein MUC50_22800 [Myxococcota bacterium]|jgi:hypothetical protein|nr:hypothetical protein [Myxococcota bacterium]